MERNISKRGFVDYKHWVKIIFLDLFILFIAFTFVFPFLNQKQWSSLYGVYYPIPKAIGINMHQNLSMYDLKHVVNHEVGHHIWYKCLNNSLINQYKQIYNNINRSCKERDSLTEDFAESYAVFSLSDWKLCKEKNKFFTKIYYINVECS